MLTKTKLRALVPGKWVRTRVPDYECWREPGTNIRPGDEVAMCVMPKYEPHYGCPAMFQWYYGVAYRRPGSDYFHKERKDGYLISTWDFGLISPLDPRFHASTLGRPGETPGRKMVSADCGGSRAEPAAGRRVAATLARRLGVSVRLGMRRAAPAP